MFKEVQDVFKNYEDAVNEKDVEKFLLGYAPDVHLFDCWGKWEHNGIEQWKGAVMEWFSGVEEEGVQLRAELTNEVVKENEGLAHVHGAIKFAGLDEEGKELRSVTNRFSFMLEKVDGSWQITHEHSSLPISTEDGKAIFG